MRGYVHGVRARRRSQSVHMDADRPVARLPRPPHVRTLWSAFRLSHRWLTIARATSRTELAWLRTTLTALDAKS
ncbi:hypothetical protein ABZX65_29615 [Streptomyces sp. NPDC003300]|uniref:hypothetical protein n=1 Tax=unclassified Streptomyces TaxID=2593676 RepID=UPI0033B44611